MPGLDSDTKLLLHCDGIDESTTFTDVSDSGHTVNVTATAEVDTAEKKWGTGSALFDGDSGYFAIDNHADWDLCKLNTDDWTVDFWVRHATHTDYETYLKQYEDDQNQWAFYHFHSAGIIFQVYSGGSAVIDTGSAGEIEDTNWYHLALCKVASEYGIYKGGTQISYVDDSDTDTFTGSLYIGAFTGGAFLDGHMDEIRIHHYNYFGAAPNDTPDDTITVPPSSYARDLEINVHDCTDLVDKVIGG